MVAHHYTYYIIFLPKGPKKAKPASVLKPSICYNDMIKVERLTVEYPKPKRFPLGAIPAGKKPMSQEHAAAILKGKVAVEEKLDGTPVKLTLADPAIILFAEDLRRQHEIFYHLPGRYAIFDIFNMAREMIVCPAEKASLAREIRNGKIRITGLDSRLFFAVPRIAEGKFALDELPQFLGISAYARKDGLIHEPAPGEGIVVKSFVDWFPEEKLAGKLVRAEFIGAIKENYLRGPVRHNAIDPKIHAVARTMPYLCRPLGI